MPDDLKFEMKLKVGELTERGDFGRGIVRISAKDMKKVGVNEGDIIEIEGKRKTSAIVVRAYPADIGLDIIRMDGLVRKNCGAGISEIVRVRKADVKEAKFVRIAPARKGIVIHIAGDLLKRNLLMRPLMTGDIIIPNPVVQARREDVFDKFFFGIDTSDFFFTAFGEEKFVVISTEPKGSVRVTRETEVELLPQATEITEEKVPDVTYEDLGGLHEEVKLVREMIELPLKHPELFEWLGIEPPKGILLHGPPGTGKTLLAKAVANESGASFFLINGPEVMCVDGETKIFTNPKGYVKAKEVFENKGDVVADGRIKVIKLEKPITTYGFKNNEIVKTKITHVSKLKATSYKVVLSDGNELVVSENQPFLVYENGKLVWKRISELKECAHVARINNLSLEEKSFEVPLNEIRNLIEKNGMFSLESRNRDRSNFIKLPKATSDDLMEFLGLMVSEGSIDEKKATITFSNSDTVLRKRYQELLKKVFSMEKSKEYADGRVMVYSKTLIEFLKILGFDSKNKVVIPRYFYTLPRSEVMSFVRGYFDGDGTVAKMKIKGMEYPTPRLYSVSREFLQEFQALIQVKLGISSALKRHKTPKGMMHALVIRGYDGRIKFAAIGSNVKEKQNRLEQIFKVRKAKEFENIPRPELLISAVRTLPYKNYRNHDFYIYGNRGFTRHELEQLKEIAKKNSAMNPDILNEVELLSRNDIAWERIESIETVGERELYDFTVEDDSFVGAPYFLLHNSKFYGESEENLRKKFDEAEKNAPSIIFIDEIDSIAPKREEVRGEVEKRVVSQLLTLLDGLKTRGKIIVIGATNIPNAIDPALRRPGRLDREIEIGVPTKDGRKEILQIHTRGMPLANDVDLGKISDITYGYVGADLNALCKEAAMHALRRVLPDIGTIKKDTALPQDIREKLIVTMDDFSHALKMVEPSAMREVMIEVPNIKWSDIGGLEAVKQSLIESIEWPLKNPDAFKRVGIRPPKGVMLYGPPGCGKTMLAKAVANESDANFIYVKASDLLSMWVGESEKHVRDVFRRAKQVAPSIIFFDEIDSMVPRRGSATDSHVTERVVSQMLAEISGLEDMQGIVVIAATNRPDIIDPALLRPGRFDRQILVPTPDMKARLEILKINTKSMPISGVDIDELAAQTESYSGADLEALCREAAMNALRKNMTADKITKRDFDKALKEVKPSVSEDMNKFYESIVARKKREKIEEDVSYTG